MIIIMTIYNSNNKLRLLVDYWMIVFQRETRINENGNTKLAKKSMEKKETMVYEKERQRENLNCKREYLSRRDERQRCGKIDKMF